MSELEISLTPKAIEMAKTLQQEQPEYQQKALRLYLEGKGCDGFFYGVSFDLRQPEDKSFYYDGIELVVDDKTLLFCQGSEIEWVDDDRGQGFLVNNPRHRNYRGKFYKRKAWQDKLTRDQNV